MPCSTSRGPTTSTPGWRRTETQVSVMMGSRWSHLRIPSYRNPRAVFSGAAADHSLTSRSCWITPPQREIPAGFPERQFPASTIQWTPMTEASSRFEVLEEGSSPPAQVSLPTGSVATTSRLTAPSSERASSAAPPDSWPPRSRCACLPGGPAAHGQCPGGRHPRPARLRVPMDAK